MNVLFINQTFYPDRVATAQYLTDLARAARDAGHHVTVLTSGRGYDDSSLTFPTSERWQGIDILRVRGTRFGKAARWRRAVDFATHLAASAVRLARLPRFDVVVCLTSPPLVSTLGALVRVIRGGRFVFWVMDLNPDEAIAAGWLRADSAVARVLEAVLRFSLTRADAIVALDRFMRVELHKKGVAPDKVWVVPPWPHEDVEYDEPGRTAFRRLHGLTDSFVVMYAGNHSPCNPLGSVIEAARRLAAVRDVKFCFVGGGSEFRKVQASPAGMAPPNLIWLPYQPRDQLAAMLSAADLHVVTLGDAFRGVIHPSKIYNVLKVGAPVLYIGPSPSHVTDLLDECPWVPCWRARHHEVDRVAAAIRRARLQHRTTPRTLIVPPRVVSAPSIRTWLHLLDGTSAVTAQVRTEHA